MMLGSAIYTVEALAFVVWFVPGLDLARRRMFTLWHDLASGEGFDGKLAGGTVLGTAVHYTAILVFTLLGEAVAIVRN